MSIQLELGKTYLNREGEQVKIIKHLEHYYFPWVSECRNYYKDNGCWNDSSQPHDFDLIEEVSEFTPVAASADSASDFLQEARDIMAERGKQYDSPEGERSMGKTVAAFNTITGRELTEAEGWLFMSVLKKVRQYQGQPHLDSCTDDVAYAALFAEARMKEVQS